MIGAAGTFAAPQKRPQDDEFYSAEQAMQHAIEWCKQNPAWVPIYLLDDIDQYSVQWHELSDRERKRWGSEYAYNEFAEKREKVPTGFISGKGEFYSDVLQIPLFHNMMMVFRVGVKKAKAIRASQPEGETN